MKLLLIGSGGREHALAWKLAQSPRLDRLYAAPGNPGIAQCAELAAIDAADHRAVIDFCRRHSIGLVVIGPEAPLVDGLADNLRAKGIAVFGPDRIPAQRDTLYNHLRVHWTPADDPTPDARIHSHVASTAPAFRRDLPLAVTS